MPRAEPTPDSFVCSGQFIELDGIRLFTVRTGESSVAFPVIFLHGIPSWSWLWRHVLPVTGTLAQSIAVDLPGFGMSDELPDGSYQVRDLAETIERLLDIVVGESTPVSLVVHDFGALVGAELVSRSPNRYRSIVVTNTSLRSTGWMGGGPLSILSIPGIGHLSMALAQPWMLQMAMRPFVAEPGGRTGPAFDGYWYPFRHGFGQNLARMFQQQMVEPADFEHWRAALGAYTGEVLVCWGALDPTFTTHELADLCSIMPGAQVTTFSHASHFLPEDRPRALGRRIRKFLAE
jgi:haloalkane dehalogenase